VHFQPFTEPPEHKPYIPQNTTATLQQQLIAIQKEYQLLNHQECQQLLQRQQLMKEQLRLNNQQLQLNQQMQRQQQRRTQLRQMEQQTQELQQQQQLLQRQQLMKEQLRLNNQQLQLNQQMQRQQQRRTQLRQMEQQTQQQHQLWKTAGVSVPLPTAGFVSIMPHHATISGTDVQPGRSHVRAQQQQNSFFMVLNFAS
jgi:hypothetical protein